MNISKKAAKMLPFMALVAAFTTSCSSDNLADGDQQASGNGEVKTMSLTATVEGDNANTRVGMSKRENNTATFFWHEGDQIAVQGYDKTNQNYAKANFKTTDPTGSTKAQFSYAGEESSTLTACQYAGYPYDHVTFDAKEEKAVTFTLPKTYTYDKMESNIFSKTTDGTTTYPVNKVPMAMLGKITDGKVEFKHVGGLAVIRIDNMPMEEGKLVILTDQQLSGDFKISDMSANTPEIATTKVSADDDLFSYDETQKVAITFSNATVGGVGVFYLPMATGSYTDVKIALTTTDVDDEIDANYIKWKALEKLDVARATVTAIHLEDKSQEIAGHKFVDLGLPSGLLWAETNLGATTAGDYGNYYAWGETKPHESNNYTLAAYSYAENSDFTKYNSTDKKTVLEADDDAATATWGSSCRMPTNEEFGELVEYCTFEWKKVANSANEEIGGIQVRSLLNGNSIFLPDAGYYSEEGSLEVGKRGNYWSSTLKPDDDDDGFGLAYYLDSNSWTSRKGDTETYNGHLNYRYCGKSIRPVAKLNK